MELPYEIQNLYRLDAFHKKYEEGEIHIDLLKSSGFSSKNTTFIVDLDHTILNISYLMKSWSEAFHLYNPLINENNFLEAYNNAKDKENYYNYKKHLSLLARLIKPNTDFEIEEDLLKIFVKTIKENIHLWIHPNIKDLLDKHNKNTNFIFITAGFKEYQRLKVFLVLLELHFYPDAIIYPQRLYKGQVVRSLFDGIVPEISLGDNTIYIIDDNIAELTDIQNHNKTHPNLKLVRVKQKDGKYNEKSFDKEKYDIIDLDLTNGESINLP